MGSARKRISTAARSSSNWRSSTRNSAMSLPFPPSPPAAAGRASAGFVHEAGAQRLFKNSFEGQTAYLCGPPPMIEACIKALMQGRLFEKHIFLERFLTQGDAAARPKSPVFRRL